MCKKFYDEKRASIWTHIEDAIAGKDTDVILGAETLQDTNPEIGRNKLFWPAMMAFDGSSQVPLFGFVNQIWQNNVKRVSFWSQRNV